ncbi:MAG: hypothetical protein WCA49_17950 [Candidatus Sulfotelmatobacter sp.]
MDGLEHQIRLNVLLELAAELYDANLRDVISVKEWLEAKADMLRTCHAASDITTVEDEFLP